MYVHTVKAMLNMLNHSTFHNLPFDALNYTVYHHHYSPLNVPHFNAYFQSYCYHGRCRSRESQCQKLWGVTGHDSISTCYEYYNTMGVANGNCGINWIHKNFTKCAKK